MPTYYLPPVTYGAPNINSGLNFTSGSLGSINQTYPNGDTTYARWTRQGFDAGSSMRFSQPSLVSHEYVTSVALMWRGFMWDSGSGGSFASLGLGDYFSDPWSSGFIWDTSPQSFYNIPGSPSSGWATSPSYPLSSFPTAVSNGSTDAQRVSRIQAGVFMDNGSGGGTAPSMRLYEINLKVVTAYLDTQNTSAPTISGQSRRTKTLTCNPGSWNRNGGSFTYQWYRWIVGVGWSAIPGASSSAYVPTNTDVGTQLLCQVGAVNESGVRVYANTIASNVIEGFNQITNII